MTGWPSADKVEAHNKKRGRTAVRFSLSVVAFACAAGLCLLVPVDVIGFLAAAFGQSGFRTFKGALQIVPKGDDAADCGAESQDSGGDFQDKIQAFHSMSLQI